MKIDLSRKSNKLLLLWLSADLVLIVLHVVHSTSGLFADSNYSIALERGFGETFQYLKEGWIALALILVAIRAANGLYAGWAVLFGFLLVDDLFAARERLGKLIGFEFEFGQVLGLRPQDLGELIIIGLAVLVLGIPTAVDYFRGDLRARSFWRSMVPLLVALAAFGVLFDAIHVALRSDPSWDVVFGTIEEGGEMIVMSLILRLVFQTWHASPSAGSVEGCRRAIATPSRRPVHSAVVNPLRGSANRPSAFSPPAATCMLGFSPPPADARRGPPDLHDRRDRRLLQLWPREPGMGPGLPLLRRRPTAR